MSFPLKVVWNDSILIGHPDGRDREIPLARESLRALSAIVRVLGRVEVVSVRRTA